MNHLRFTKFITIDVFGIVQCAAAILLRLQNTKHLILRGIFISFLCTLIGVSFFYTESRIEKFSLNTVDVIGDSPNRFEISPRSLASGDYSQPPVRSVLAPSSILH
jgi:hypothetical protein